MVDTFRVDRRTSRRFSTDIDLDVLIPRAGLLGRARTVELHAADLSMFGVSVLAEQSDGLKRGQVVRITLDDATTTAIVRHEEIVDDAPDSVVRYGLEFIRPSDEFIVKTHDITNMARELIGEQVSEELWLRSS